ncbi:hypothetical protein TESG_04230 [Trichophyton tonsurans CBS 112818]|uniref:Uncharacterized protein n=1 Tax=Trichophyton tonsurans (strain CBS 112818) TaxID=647933 RepID=F2RZW9_TRIT1|nr:hypothetical protein TESG_04230 [Trichophyton tonsurans CBS 112818]
MPGSHSLGTTKAKKRKRHTNPNKTPPETIITSKRALPAAMNESTEEHGEIVLAGSKGPSSLKADRQSCMQCDGQPENSSKAVWRMEYGGLMFDVEASFACLPIFLTNLTRLYI